MGKLLAILVLFIGVLNTCLAQEPITDGPKKNTYVHNKMKLANRDILRIVSENEQAYELVKKGQTLQGIALVPALVGGGAMGWGLAEAFTTSDPSWGLLGAGIGLITVAIVLENEGHDKIRAGVDLYNEGLEAKAMSQKPKFDLAFTGTGLGLRMTF